VNQIEPVVGDRKKMAQRSNVGGTVQSWRGVAVGEQGVATTSLGGSWGGDTKNGLRRSHGHALEPGQATDPRAVAAVPTSPRLSRQGAASSPSGQQWLSPVGFWVAEYYGDIGLCEGLGLYI
jgi:hypothetical protein